MKSVQARLNLNLKETKVMSTEEIEEFALDGNKVKIEWDVFLGAKIEDSRPVNFETIGIRQIDNDSAKQGYNNYNKMQNNECISFPSSVVWL